WFEIIERIRPVADLYFGSVYAPQMFMTQRFLNYVQAAEAYHRRCFAGNDIAPSRHSTRVAQILESTPEKHYKWLKNQLQRSNQIGLRRRLKFLVERNPTSLEGFVDGSFLN